MISCVCKVCQRIMPAEDAEILDHCRNIYCSTLNRLEIPIEELAHKYEEVEQNNRLSELV